MLALTCDLLRIYQVRHNLRYLPPLYKRRYHSLYPISSSLTEYHPDIWFILKREPRSDKLYGVLWKDQLGGFEE
jgi:hypothetical protein